MACLADQAHGTVGALQSEAPALLRRVDLRLGEVEHGSDSVRCAVTLEPAHIRGAGDHVQGTDDRTLWELPHAVCHAAKGVQLEHVAQGLVPLVETAAAVLDLHRVRCGLDARVEAFLDVSEHAELIAAWAQDEGLRVRCLACDVSGLYREDRGRCSDHSRGVLDAALTVSDVSRCPMSVLGRDVAGTVELGVHIRHSDVRPSAEHSGRVARRRWHVRRRSVPDRFAQVPGRSVRASLGAQQH